MRSCARSRRSRGWKTLDRRALLRLGRALIEQYCTSFRRVPKRIVLDIDDTFDWVHGGQQLHLFNAFHDDYVFQPIVVFDGEGRFEFTRKPMATHLERPAGESEYGHTSSQ
jgi:hypothetical protein